MDAPDPPPPVSSAVDVNAPSSVEDGFVAVASTRDPAPRMVPIARWKVVVALASAIVALLLTAGFFVDAAIRIRDDRSMDMPFPGNRRVGLFGTNRFTHWVCNEGHEHLSAPYWVGAITVVAITALLFYVFARLARRPRA